MQWFQNLNLWLEGYLPWFAVTAGVGGLIAYAVGLPFVLNMLSKFVEIVAPIFKLIVDAFVAALRWSWETIFWPGLKDIFDSWVTIVTVITMCLVIYGYMDRKVDRIVDDLDFCQSEKTRLERTLKKSQSPASQDWFGGFRLW